MATEDIPEIELIIKASTIDGRRKGACLFCQEYFMDLYLLAELKTISLKVTTVDMLRPPPDFRSNFDSTPPPILIDNGQAVLENEKIERYIMKNVPGGHNLFVQDKETATVIENLYSKFKLALAKNDEASQSSLLKQLKNINQHLDERGDRFLTGDSMCCFDCELMPKLQHIRIAGKYFFEFEIPSELRALWRYMGQMYSLDAFTQSCPADQDIINHYKQQMHVKLSRHEELEAPTFTTSIPPAPTANSVAGANAATTTTSTTDGMMTASTNGTVESCVMQDLSNGEAMPEVQEVRRVITATDDGLAMHISASSESASSISSSNSLYPPQCALESPRELKKAPINEMATFVEVKNADVPIDK